jgi:monovalent cation:H+ antiporter-2, CPA2 family
MEGGPLGPVLILLALGMPLAVVARRLRISALVAYLVTGALVGPHGPFPLIAAGELSSLAEIGATLLLFSLGLEMDLHTMRPRLKQVAIGSGLQMGLTLVVGTGLGTVAGLSLAHSIALACCVTMSSTLMVMRALEERHLRESEEGRMAMGLLLMQDLGLAPMLVVVSLLSPVEHHASMTTMILAAALCLAATFLLRRVLATTLMSKIRDAHLPELEVAFSVVVALGAAYLTSQAGLGPALGAFCAGLALGGDEHRSVIESSTKPLQGLMAIIFFVSMGLLFDIDAVMTYPFAVIGGLAITVVLKGALSAGALRIAGMPLRSAIGCGIMTSQIGEFSFVLAATAFTGDPANDIIYRLMVAITCLSLAVTPLLVHASTYFLPRSPLDDIVEPGDTVVVAGLGPVGNSVVDTLHRLGYPLLLIDRNDRLLAPWRDTPDVRVHKGRIEHMEEWLPVLGRRPALVVLSFPIADTSALVTSRLRTMDPKLPIIARAQFSGQIDALHNAGAQYVICDESETIRALIPALQEALGPPRAQPKT